MNNYLKSIQDSERSSVFSVKKKVVSKSKGSKQIIIEGTSSSFVTES